MGAPPGTPTTGSPCSRCAAPIGSEMFPDDGAEVRYGPRWHDACRRCAASATAPSKDCWPGTRPRNVRRPKIDPKSRTPGLGPQRARRPAGPGRARVASRSRLISLLAMNALRISEALGATSTTWTSTSATAPCRSCASATSRSPSRWRPAGPSPRPVQRRTRRRAYLPRCRRQADGPLRRRPHGEAARPAGGDHQADQRTVCATASAPPAWTPACRCGTCRKRSVTVDPRTAMRYDRARQWLDRHATYIVAAFLAGAAR
jgi:hypothetical protein